MSLSQLAPIILSPSDRLRVLISDSVFQKGTEIYKNYIICYYNGRALPFNKIQSVFNHLRVKRKRLEIHNNPLNRSTTVMIQNEYLKQKILEKYILNAGDTMFHTAQWSSEHAKSTPPSPLRHRQGLSLVVGLVGDPTETEDFTINMVSLTLSHVKVGLI